MEFGAAYLWAPRAQKWPFENAKRHRNRVSPATERQQNGVTLRPPIKGRIPQVNDSTPVALYQWNLLERQKPGIPLTK